MLRVFPVDDCSTNEPRAEMKLIFTVEDTGRGIAAEELDFLFKPFVQTQSGREIAEETGLGLAISHKFVRLMGGDIQVDSVEDRGSVFKFDLLVQIATPEEFETAKPDKQVLALKPDLPPMSNPNCRRQNL